MNFITENFGYKVTIKADKQLLIEGHKGVSSYTLQEVIIRVKGGKLKISGDELNIAEINEEELFLEGKFNSLEVLRK